MIGIGAAVLAAGLWVAAAQSARDGLGAQPIAFGAVAVLVSLTAYAFLGVASFSARYRARSAPVFSAGRDRFVVRPWVSRTGAIDLRPEGRLGAAIPIGELRKVSVVTRDDRSVVEIDNDHGPIDALSTEDPRLAEAVGAALQRALEETRHPGAGSTAKQRARARAKT